MGDAAEDLQRRADVARLFRQLESEPVAVQGTYEQRVDGGQVGDPMQGIGDAAMQLRPLYQLPPMERDALIAYYQGRGIIHEIREKRAAFAEGEDGVARMFLYDAPQETWHERIRLANLSPRQRSQLKEKLAAAHRLGMDLDSRLSNEATAELVLEWANCYRGPANERIKDMDGISQSTLDRARKETHRGLDDIRSEALKKFHEGVDRLTYVK